MSSFYKLDNITDNFQLQLICRTVKMILKTLQIIITVVSATCIAFPTDVDDFERLSSSLSKEKYSFKNVTSNKTIARGVETLLQESGSPFVSHYTHNGHNFFFKPNIVLGTNIEKGKEEISKKMKKRERKKKLSTSTTTTTAAPTITSIKTDNNTFSENREKEEIKVPQQPVISKPVILKESEPVAQPIVIPQTPSIRNFKRSTADLLPRDVGYILVYLPMNFRDQYSVQESSVSPTSSQYQGTHETLSDEKSLISPKSSEIAPLQLPVIIISSPEIAGTMPYEEKVSKKSMENPNYCIPQVLGEKKHLKKQKDKAINMPSLSTFWAHKIALARALPKIMPNKEKIYDPYLPH